MRRADRAGAPRRATTAALLLAATLLAACSPQALLLDRAADALAAAGSGDEDDLELARDAAPVLLKASEALLAERPGHLGLAQSVAAGFTQYAWAFVASEADRIEGRDLAAARTLRDRAARLYRRAHRHAMAALERAQPGLAASLSRADGAPLAPALVPLAYWAAASWGAAIALEPGNADALADLPRAAELARRAWATAPGHGEGELAALMGRFEAARPGGSTTRAEALFAGALDAGASNPAVHVAVAETLAQPAGDRARFEAALARAIAVAAGRNDLAARVMRSRAERLLAAADDLF